MKFILIITLVAIVGFLIFAIDFKSCIKSHTEEYWEHRWVQIIPAGKVMVPITHPAGTSTRTVCDEYEPTH